MSLEWRVVSVAGLYDIIDNTGVVFRELDDSLQYFFYPALLRGLPLQSQPPVCLSDQSFTNMTTLLCVVLCECLDSWSDTVCINLSWIDMLITLKLTSGFKKERRIQQTCHFILVSVLKSIKDLCTSSL